MNKLLFMYGEMRHGGIETLIVRLANFLATHGRQVAVCTPGGDLAGQFDERVRVLLWADRKDAARQACEWVGKGGEPVTMISFDPISAALALAAEAMNGKRVPLLHLSGVYHPRSFFMTGERRDRIWLNRLVAKAVGDSRIFYMNAECREAHERRWRSDLGVSPIIPLPVAEQPMLWRGGGADGLRLVSVGRLVDFKTYNLSAAEITRESRNAGIALDWDIYGAGPLEDAIAQATARHGVDQAVTLKGVLPYAEFPETVAGYDLFVGMGTAALEAAMIGVPTIVATESESRRTYGYLHDLPFGNVGERQRLEPGHDLGELIMSYARSSEQERQAISRRCRAAALAYGMTGMVERLDALAQAPPPGPGLQFKRAVSRLYEGLTASPAAELARRVKARLGH